MKVPRENEETDSTLAPVEPELRVLSTIVSVALAAQSNMLTTRNLCKAHPKAMHGASSKSVGAGSKGSPVNTTRTRRAKADVLLSPV